MLSKEMDFKAELLLRNLIGEWIDPKHPKNVVLSAGSEDHQ